MKLHDFLNKPGAPAPLQFAAAVGLTSDQPVRQWGKDVNRRPAPEYVHAVWRETGWQVAPWDMYPALWWKIWPNLIGTVGAPPLPAGAKPFVFPSDLALAAA